MSTEARTCQNCKQEFRIEPADFAFYQKMDVPPPTFCPECRLRRRMTWRNERALYKRKCDVPGHTEDIISMYAPQENLKVYDLKYWWSDGWDALEYGREYDFSKSFFTQFRELFASVPLISVSNVNSVNSDYCNWVDQNKNCYLNFGCGWNEDVNYANKTIRCKDSQDSLLVQKSELCYECVNCIDCYNLRYGVNCKGSSDSYFLYDCRNCSNCFGCANLTNTSYCIFNHRYSKEEYLKKIKEFIPSTRQQTLDMQGRFQKEIYLNSIHRFANIINSVNCTGNNLVNSKNLSACFDNFGEFEDSKYLYIGFGAKDSYDCIGPGKTEQVYENVDTDVGSRVLFTVTTYNSSDAYYSFNCHSCHNIFGCIGVRNKEYCILNKQYSKSDYENLIPRIKKQMSDVPYQLKVNGQQSIVYKYGEFFPSELSPFCYNETLAQEYFPLHQSEVVRLGLRWRNQEERQYVVTKQPAELESLSVGDPSLLQEVIGCQHQGQCLHQCTQAFKFIPQELDFYKKTKLPLPELCPNCRHYERLAKQNPLKLWHRTCQCTGRTRTSADYTRTYTETDPRYSASSLRKSAKYVNTCEHFHGDQPCSNKFETSYAPERPEIVYCEACYQAEVA